MTSHIKHSKAYDVLLNNDIDDDIEVKSIKSNQENVPFAFQKRDKIPRDDILTTEKEMNSPIPPNTPTSINTPNISNTQSTPISPVSSSTPNTPNTPTSQIKYRNSYSSYSAISSLSNLPYDERPVPTLYNKIKKEKEEKKARLRKEREEREREEREREERVKARAKKTVSLMDIVSEERKLAQLSWKKSMVNILIIINKYINK
ncbi:hypothetical protein BCR32DRAFT_278804 [Anaeromyces robustus]|uniref:Uncharacterized protein n=1 Tax=Anaeromyces robustus TaxID=1754192 RepID=A0A1Y1X9Z7_9FUNG|nr:hypothetical protein BCR32DRAFT_278804 [Anaeromyces robustus]|eukprot:ORX82572.1 hypothetical protein BCR32DRAFT_278804 [Anaeromyces robustus]